MQERNDALVHLRPDVPDQLLAGFGGHPDAGSSGEFQQPAQPGIAAVFALTGDRDVVNSLGAGAQRLLHRVQTVENLHPSSVRGLRRDADSREKPLSSPCEAGYPREDRKLIPRAQRDFLRRIRVFVQSEERRHTNRRSRQAD